MTPTYQKKPKKLPKDIAQLVDKRNFVIAITSLSEKKGISLADAKAWIDDYEVQQNGTDTIRKTTTSPVSDHLADSDTFEQNQTHDSAAPQGFSSLTSSVSEAIESQGVSARVIPKWLRILQVIILLILLSYLYTLLF